jgi:hypothetical protein
MITALRQPRPEFASGVIGEDECAVTADDDIIDRVQRVIVHDSEMLRV